MLKIHSCPQVEGALSAQKPEEAPKAKLLKENVNDRSGCSIAG